METIELDNYNRKYGDKKPKIKKPKENPQAVQHRLNKSAILTNYGSEKHISTRNEKFQTKIAASAGNQTGLWNTFARHGDHNATTAKRWGTLPKFANLRPPAG